MQSPTSQIPLQQGALTVVVRHCSRSHSPLLSAVGWTFLKGSTQEHKGRTPKLDVELKEAGWRKRPLRCESERLGRSFNNKILLFHPKSYTF